MFRTYVLPWLVYILYRLWSLTWRMECHEPEALKQAKANGEPLVFAHWHGDELCIVPLITPYRIATMVSTSKDGSLMAFVIQRYGGGTSRGSSTRGGVSALKGLVRLMHEGYRASIAVDGPKGPFHRVKPGIFELSRLAHARIVPMGAAPRRTFVFEKSWNKAKLPKPFTRLVVQFGEPWAALTRNDDARSPELAARLEADIAKACLAADHHLR